MKRKPKHSNLFAGINLMGKKTSNKLLQCNSFIQQMNFTTIMFY